MSARKCFLPILSNAARCAKPGALILHLYGIDEPSETKYTPNSPINKYLKHLKVPENIICLFYL